MFLATSFVSSFRGALRVTEEWNSLAEWERMERVTLELENAQLKQRVRELEESVKEMNEALKESTKLLVRKHDPRTHIDNTPYGCLSAVHGAV